MPTPHIGDAESHFLVVNVAPDFCKVHGKVVPYDIFQHLASEKVAYADSFHARGVKVLRVGSEVKAVIGDAGKGVVSGTATGGGDSLLVEGSATFHVQGKPVCRHGDLALMNGG